MKRQCSTILILFFFSAVLWGSSMSGGPGKPLTAGSNISITDTGASYVISASTSPLSAIDTDCRVSTGTLRNDLTIAQSDIASLKISTGSLQAQIDNISAGIVNPATGIMNGDLATGVKVSTGNLHFAGTPSSTKYYCTDGTMKDPGQGAGDATQAGNNVWTGNNIHSGPESFATLSVSTMTVSSMTITNLMVTNMAGDFQGAKVGTATVALSLVSEDFTTYISSPYMVIGSTIPITKYNLSYAVTYTTITVNADTGTNVVVSFTSGAAPLATATTVLSGAVTATAGTAWIGGTFANATVAAGNTVYAHIISVSGNVRGLTIRGSRIKG